MFDKHTFTCPDVIYLRKKAKKNQLIALTVQIGFFGSLWAYGKVLETRDNKLAVVPKSPAENPE